jgi:hypothetical protein
MFLLFLLQISARRTVENEIIDELKLGVDEW